MNTLLNSAQQAQFDQFNAFAREHLAPVAGKLTSGEADLKQFLSRLGEQGYLGLNVPKEHGGSGGTLLETAMLVEALAEYDPGLGLTIGNHAAGIEVVKRFGSAEQKSKYLPLLARGEQFATVAFSEENAGTDFEAVEATICGADEFKLTASKRWVVSGGFADLFLILAKKDDGSLAVLLVDRPALGQSFSVAPECKVMGLSSARLQDVEFSNLSVSGANVFAEAGSVVAQYAMDVAKVVLAAASVGLLDGAAQQATEHARQRQQFGKSIGQFQAVQWKLADLECDRIASRLFVYRAAWSLAEAPEKFKEYAAMCKWYAARAARFHSGEALQIFGSAGLAADHAMARFYDDAKVMEIAQGTSELQKMLLVKELNV